ncbi:LysR substrate-binding domain-containing protein [Donghicola mangrovi]|uniref:LysR family transcriptional regulator n=1 Tax=Donghicola mangrovi TaxID=2729614 RepID=A0A850QCQ2_9RHOB|nr:LysR substrate-binding domain-containing protein [Donghicola mangrovi]NVO23939.1 LysR family transcriptional regulator [Donghicola mangrovi]
MAKRPYDMPSMTSLACFESAARHSSFKLAASELNVTPAAVSHQIKALEVDLGRQLFRRHHRGVELSESGAYLFIAVQRGFEGISDAVGQLRLRMDRTDVMVHASTAVSSLWLTPRLAAFWKHHPETTVSQHVSDDPAAARSCDLSIEYGPLPEGGPDAIRPLFNGRIMALGSPRFRDQNRIGGLADLTHVPLIHLSAEDRDWTKWSDWFAALGLEMGEGRGFSVNNYVVALEAAQDDMGAVLGWTELLGDRLDTGKLVPLVPQGIDAPQDFYLRIHPEASTAAIRLADWLTAAVQR